MQLDSEVLFPVVETTVENSFVEELFSDFIHGNPQHEPDSVEVKILYPDQLSNFEEVPKIMFDSERNESTCSLDQVEEDYLIKHPLFPNYIPQDDDIVVNDMFPVKDLAISTISSLDNAENDASVVNCQASSSISYPSINPSNLLESFPASPCSNRIEMESNEIELTKISLDLNAEKRENQLEPFSDMTSPVSSLTNLEESPSTFDDSHWKYLEVSEEVARDSLIEFTSRLVVDQLKIASTDELLSLNRSDFSNSSICNNFQCSLHKEEDQDSSSLNDMKMVSQCSELDSQDSESTIVCKNDLQNNKDIKSLGEDLKRREAFVRLQNLAMEFSQLSTRSSQWAFSPGLVEESIKGILDAFLKATQYANKWAKAWHKWALFNTTVMSHYTLRGFPDTAAQFVVAAVTGYFHSIACAANSKSVDGSLQDILRLLTLWFNHGATAEVQMALRKS
ncbi:hypothetical protein KIW84_012708 [Lathyrus oleraceus]|uniref:PIK-related kinase FAT domain-containing protein n=1 Tax=Pisum sativum TaxID=3888 RepID=A0A9D5BIG0_PEA|nr:hypothetical protein KIW84_012708 [Pisum sativum]